MNTAFNIAQRNYDCALPDTRQDELEEHVAQLASDTLDEIIPEILQILNISELPLNFDTRLYDIFCDLHKTIIRGGL